MIWRHMEFFGGFWLEFCGPSFENVRASALFYTPKDRIVVNDTI